MYGSLYRLSKALNLRKSIDLRWGIQSNEVPIVSVHGFEYMSTYIMHVNVTVS